MRTSDNTNDDHGVSRKQGPAPGLARLMAKNVEYNVALFATQPRVEPVARKKGSEVQCTRHRLYVGRSLARRQEQELLEQIEALEESDMEDPRDHEARVERKKQLEALNAELVQLARLNFQQGADRVLASVTPVLEKAGHEFWLAMGSLLGWYRECDWLAHDHDVDFMLWADDFEGWSRARFEDEFVRPIARALDWTLVANDADWPRVLVIGENRPPRPNDRFGKEFRLAQLLFLTRAPQGRGKGEFGNLRHVEFVFLQKRKPHYWWTTNSEWSFFRWRPFELCWTTMRDQRVRVPCNAEQMVADTYGPAWRQPPLLGLGDVPETQYSNHIGMPEHVYFVEVASNTTKRIAGE